MSLPVDRVISIELVIMLNDGFEASIWVAALGREQAFENDFF